MDLPTITKSAYASSSLDPMAVLGLAPERHVFQAQPANLAQAIGAGIANQLLQKEQQVMSNARIVKVFIADPNENLPLEKRVLYRGEEKLTDLTDQELFYEVAIADLLTKHNEYRKTVVDKKQAEKFGRDIFMEPARIRDLRMVVVDVAKF